MVRVLGRTGSLDERVEGLLSCFPVNAMLLQSSSPIQDMQKAKVSVQLVDTNCGKASRPIAQIDCCSDLSSECEFASKQLAEIQPTNLR
jgi:hypothetical protein